MREIPKGMELSASFLESVVLEKMCGRKNWWQTSVLEKVVEGKMDDLCVMVKPGAYSFHQILMVFQVLTWRCKVFRQNTADACATDGNALDT